MGGIPTADDFAFVRIRLTDVPAIVGLAGAYVLAARIGLSFDPVAGFATLVWPPSGIALAALLLLGKRAWPGVLIGATLANVFAGAPVVVAIGIGIGNTMEAVVGSILLRRIPGFVTSLETIHGVLGLIGLAALLATAISATVGVATLALVGIVGDGVRLSRAWQAWWVGDMVGVLLVAPIVLVWRTAPLARFKTRTGESLALSAAIVVVSGLTFFAPVGALPPPFHQAHLMVAVLIWAALRYGQRGAVTATFVLSTVAVVATVNGYGPFALADPHQSLLSLQTFLAIVAVIKLLLGATISERRLALDHARSSEADALRASRAKSEFLGVMSHELRTPLNAIAGFCELVRTGVYGPVNRRQAEALGRIDTNERELLAHIEAVLTFVKLEKGELTMHDEPVQVVDAFDAVEPAIAPEIRRKHLVLKRELAPRLAVHADRKGLELILASLTSNASKYTEDGGAITLGADRVGDRVRIWVRDTGIGIAADQLQKMFEPFVQAEGGTTRKYTGLGLGLTIAQELARRMHGEVTIASKPGAGTTASVVLPAA